MKRAAPGCDIRTLYKNPFSKEEQPMKKIAYVGIDYHLNSLSVAVMIEGKKQPFEMIRLKNDDRVIRKYMSKLAGTFEIRACYEASSSGYSFQRKMAAWGSHCDVIAPSLIPGNLGIAAITIFGTPVIWPKTMPMGR
jgi:hypothetical protein